MEKRYFEKLLVTLHTVHQKVNFTLANQYWLDINSADNRRSNINWDRKMFSDMGIEKNTHWRRHKLKICEFFIKMIPTVKYQKILVATEVIQRKNELKFRRI